MAAFCETHWRDLSLCRYYDPECRVCGCGGLCDSKLPCPTATAPAEPQWAVAEKQRMERKAGQAPAEVARVSDPSKL